MPPGASAKNPRKEANLYNVPSSQKEKFLREENTAKTGVGKVSHHKAAIKPAAPTSNPNHAPAPSTPLVLDAAADVLEPPPAE